MPTYEYKCLKNGHVFEEFQRITDEPLKKCRVCGEAVEKLISPTAFHLKGGGWYVTDYKSSGSSSGKSGSSEAGTAAPKVESKPNSSDSGKS